MPRRRPCRGWVEDTALAVTAAFAAGALLSQTVIVPGWRAMSPETFQQRFTAMGPATGLTVFPFEVASMLALGAVACRAIRHRRPDRIAWALAAGCMAGTLVTLVYFVPTNLALLHGSYPLAALPGVLTGWYRVNWVRTGLGLAAAVLAGMARTASPVVAGRRCVAT